MVQKRKASKEIIQPKDRSRVETEKFEARNESKHTLVIIDTRGCILFADKAFAQSAGKTLSAIAGLSIRHLLPDEQAEVLNDRIRRAVSTGKQENFVIIQGSRYTENSLVPLCDAEGTIVQLALSGNDITDRKQA